MVGRHVTSYCETVEVAAAVLNGGMAADADLIALAERRLATVMKYCPDFRLDGICPKWERLRPLMAAE